MRRGALLLGLAACGGGGTTVAPDAASLDAPAGSGHVVYILDGHAWKLAAIPGATPEDLGTADWVDISPDGAHTILSTTRFGCDTWACVVVDGTAFPDLHSERGAIFGDTIVVPVTDQGHAEDLVAITGGGAPRLLTAASPHAYHHLPAFSDDGASIVFDCSEDAYSVGRTSICTVDLDGGNFREVITPDGAALALHHPDFAPDGSIAFEGDWQGEQIWRDAPRTDLSGGDADDNSPCVLPDGRVVSLWLDRPGGPSTHELKVMNADGSDPQMLLTGVDVTDGGIGCAP